MEIVSYISVAETIVVTDCVLSVVIRAHYEPYNESIQARCVSRSVESVKSRGPPGVLWPL
jgi:hypothetical protein